MRRPTWDPVQAPDRLNDGSAAWPASYPPGVDRPLASSRRTVKRRRTRNWDPRQWPLQNTALQAPTRRPRRDPATYEPAGRRHEPATSVRGHQVGVRAEVAMVAAAA